MLRRLSNAVAASLLFGALAVGTVAVGADPKPSQAPAKKPEATAKPVAPKPTREKTEAAKPNATKPVETKPAPAKPTTSKPEPQKPAAGKPEASKPAPAKPEPPKPEQPSLKKELERHLYQFLDMQVHELLGTQHVEPGHQHDRDVYDPHHDPHAHEPFDPHHDVHDPHHLEPIKPLPKVSEFAERLLLLEFADRRDSKCAATVPLINEMIRKNYPIQRVDRGKGGREADMLFRRYAVREVPTFVMLVDGREFGRVIVRRQRPDQVRVELLTLFQRGKVEVERHPHHHMPAPRKPHFGLIFKSDNAETGVTTRAQSADGFDSYESPAQPLPEDRIQELSDVIGKTRLERAVTNMVVRPVDGTAERNGNGVAVHYNDEFQEALFLTSSSLFDGLDMNASTHSVAVRVYSPLDAQYEDAVGQCVYCDSTTGLAFVAARVSKPLCPVAFLPKQSSMKVGEEAYEFARSNTELVSAKREAIAVDQRRFYSKDGVENSFVLFDQLSGQTLCVGAGCFVARNGRFYFAGLSSVLEGSSESVVTPVTIVEQALLSNRNLSAVYRDQLSGKFDVPASQDEIQYAMNVLSDPNVAKPEYAIAQEAAAQATAETNAQELAVESPSVPAVQVEASDALSAESEELAAATPPASPELSSIALDESQRSALTAAFTPQPADAFDSNAGVQYAAQKPQDEPGFATTGLLEEPPYAAADTQPVSETLEAELQQQIAQRPVDERPATQNDFAASVAEITGADLDASVTPATPNAAPAAAPGAAPVVEQAVAQTAPVVPATEQNVAQQQVQAQTQIPQYVAQQPVAQQAPILVAAQNPDGQIVQYVLNPAQAQNAEGQPVYLNVAPQAQLYATPNAGAIAYAVPTNTGVRPTAFASQNAAEAHAAYEREEEAFNAAMETLRKYALDGAEIVCIVNYANTDPNAPKESEVVRLPKRTIAARPAASTNVELVAVPQGAVVAPMQVATPYAVPAQRQYVPLTAETPAGAIVK